MKSSKPAFKPCAACKTPAACRSAGKCKAKGYANGGMLKGKRGKC